MPKAKAKPKKASKKDEVSGRDLVKSIAALKDLAYQFYGIATELTTIDDFCLSESGDDEIFKKMERDARIAAFKRQRTLGVTGVEWKIEPSTAPNGDEIAEAVDKEFRALRNFEDVQENILQAFWRGRSFQEVSFFARDGVWHIDRIRRRQQDYFRYSREDKLYLMTEENPEGEELKGFKRRRIIDLRYGATDDNPNGAGISDSCYWLYWMAKEGTKFWLYGLERFSNPHLLGKYQAGDKEGQAALETVIEELRSRSGVAIPEGTDLSLLESGGEKRALFADFLKGFCYEGIQLAILGQTLTATEGKQGTQALGKIHAGELMKIHLYDAKKLSAAVNDVINLWVDINFGEQEEYPKFVKLYEEERDDEKDIKVIKELVSVGLDIETDFVYDRFRIPRPKEGAELLTPPKAAQPASPFPQMGDTQPSETPGAPGTPDAGVTPEPEGENEDSTFSRPLAAGTLGGVYNEGMADLEAARTLVLDKMTRAVKKKRVKDS